MSVFTAAEPMTDAEWQEIKARSAQARRDRARRSRRHHAPTGQPRGRKRMNHRGDWLCLECRRYRHRDDFACPPSRQGLPWPWCRECVRVLDRWRPKYHRGTPEWHADLERRARQRRAQAQRERAERIHFVREAIAILRRRGLTKAEIVTLAGVSWSLLLAAERGQRLPDPNVARRFGILLWETRHLPTGDEPCFRRRLPHPELPALLARVGPQLAAYPVRSKWGRA